MAQIIIRDQDGHGIPYVCLRIADGNQPQEAATYDVLVKPDGSTGWPIPGWNPSARRTVYVNVGDYAQPQWSEGKIVMPDDANAEGDVVVTLTRTSAPSGAIERLMRVDPAAHRFITERGRPQFLRGVTSYLIYKRFLDGEDLRPLLDQLQALGVNMVRMFGMVTSFAHWHPQDYGDRYYSEIVPFMNLVAAHGIYGLWTACADTQQIMPSEQQALDHLLRTVDQLVQTRNALFSFVNEQGQHENGIDRQRAYDAVMQNNRIGWLQFDTGSFGEDEKCQPPFGTHVVLHVRRAYPSHVKDCCVLDHPNKVNAPHLEVLLDEPDRYGEGGNMNLEQARDSAATSYTSLGFVLHTSQGVQSQPFSGRTLEIARTVFPILQGF